ncbi:MAG TPA: cytochrome c biogenesis protein DipZ [Gaiellaceae bacterium]
MLLLAVFAFVAGAGTALSPCVLPILPALLSAGVVGGRRRPLGVAIGLSVTFALTVAGVATLLGGIDKSSNSLRHVAEAVLAAFGLCLLVPVLATRLEAGISRLTGFRPRGFGGDGFVGGLTLGAALGLVYTPCAGPILAAVVSVGAASGSVIAIGTAYALGAGSALLAVGIAGRRLFALIRRLEVARFVQPALGVILIATAAAMTAGADVRFDEFIAAHVPNATLTSWLEASQPVETRLASLRSRQAAVAASRFTPGSSANALPGLQNLGPAPGFVGNQRWFNTPDGRPLSFASLRGRVVLVDFWTYTCINCLRTLPYLRAWDTRYGSRGLTIVGVHTPEFPFEHDAGNVAAAIKRLGIRYPVVQDNGYSTWNAWGVENWPTEFLVDARGRVRYRSIGEGDYAQTEQDIRTLLTEHGVRRLGPRARPKAVVTPSPATTPETYLGSTRAFGWVPRDPTAGLHDFGHVGAPPPQSGFAFRGTWRISTVSATAVKYAEIQGAVLAKNVYLVLGSAGDRPRRVEVLLDGRPIGNRLAGTDVKDGVVVVTSQRLYHLVSLPAEQLHSLTVRVAPGVSGFAFTFG